MLDLPVIKKLCEAASPGPWEPSGAKNDVLGPKLDIIACFCEREDYEADAEFIAQARTNVPLLVAALQEAQAEIKRLEALAACYPSWMPGESS